MQQATRDERMVRVRTMRSAGGLVRLPVGLHVDTTNSQ